MKKIIIVLMLIAELCIAQNWSTAPEVWSKPVQLDSTLNKPFDWIDSPTFNRTMDTLYYTGGNGVYMAIRKIANGKTTWVVNRLGEKVNPAGQMPPTSCPLSRDGKRMYISNIGSDQSKDIWRSDWDDKVKEWKTPVNMGPGINKQGAQFFFYELSKDSAYVVSNHWGLRTIYLYTFDKQKNDWAIADSFRNVIKHPFQSSNVFGLSLTGNKRKIYFSREYLREDYNTPIEEVIKRATELVVSYWDDRKNTWGDSYYLNINSRGYCPDSVKNPSWIAGGYDDYPWISEDGKVLIFSSVRDVKVNWIEGHPISDEMPKLYISYLLKDENGKPVGIDIDKNNNPVDYYLFPNYPNPFNGSTIISYSLPRNDHVTLIVYDILGKEVAVLVDKEMSMGIHTVTFNPQLYNLSSGSYIYCIKTSSQQISKNMVYLK